LQKTPLAVAVCALLWLLTIPPASFGAPPSPPVPAAGTAAPAKGTAPPAEVPEKAPAAPGVAPKAAAPPAPASIPVPQIVAQAEEVKKLLREMDALAEPVPAIVAIQTRLPDRSANLGPELKSTLELLEQGPPIGIQERLTQSWQASAVELAGWQEVVTGRATQLEHELDRLTALRATWTQTRTDVQAARVPTPVLDNVEAVLAAIEATRVRLQSQRAVTLVLQDEVAEELTRCQETLAQIARLRKGALALTFARSAAPIWSRQLRREDFEELPARIGDELGSSATLVREFAAAHRARVLFHGLLFVVLILVMRAGRSWVRGAAAAGQSVPPAAVVLDHPYAAATVAALVSVLWIYPTRPRTVGDISGMLLLLPMLVILKRLVARPMAPALYAFAVLVLADRIRAQLVITMLGDQVLLLLEMLAAIAVLGWLLGSRRLRRALVAQGMTPGRLRAKDIATGFCLVVCLVAFGTAAYGTVRLARWLGSGLLVDVFLALAAYAAVKVADGLIAFALQAWPLRRLRMVERYRDLVERRAGRTLRVIMTGAWVIAMLTHRGLLDSAVAAGQAALAAEVRRGSLAISVGDVLAFAVTVWLAFLLSSFVRFLLEEDVFPRLEVERGLSYTISRLLHYTVLLLGFLLAIAALGMDLSKVTILAGAFGVGLGFGLQGVVNNFVSGLIVLLERPLNVGDAIQMGDVAGEVRRIGIRSTMVHTAEGAEVIVPNASLVAEKVTNWTLADRKRRIDVPVGVAYGSPPEKVLELLRGVAAAHPQVLSRPAPEAFFLEFGESALKFELRAWTDRFDQWQAIKSELNVGVYAALQGAGFEIPVPQREVRLRQP
jgi:small-conductance mechanosensitive channel